QPHLRKYTMRLPREEESLTELVADSNPASSSSHEGASLMDGADAGHEPMAGPEDAEASARPSPLQPAAKQAVDKAAPGNIFSSPKRDAKKLANKKQRELKKLLKADRRENEDIARSLQEATRAKSSTETQAKEAASKLAKAEADLSTEKQSEDALQGALNQLEPKLFFGLF
ncbi:Rnf13, partial [Symbiodinium necroappetens]